MEGGCPLDRRGFGPPPPPVRTDPGTLQKGFSPFFFFQCFAPLLDRRGEGLTPNLS